MEYYLVKLGIAQVMKVKLVDDGSVGITAQIYHHKTIAALVRVDVMKCEETVRLVASYACARTTFDQIKSVK